MHEMSKRTTSKIQMILLQSLMRHLGYVHQKQKSVLQMFEHRSNNFRLDDNHIFFKKSGGLFAVIFVLPWL